MKHDETISKLEKQSESANPHQTDISSFVERHISCRKYFRRLAKFGEDALNHSRAIANGIFHYGGFDLDLTESYI